MVALLLASGIAMSACGSNEDEGFAPAAEPAVSPRLAETPAGKVEELGGEIEGLVFDEKTGTLAAVTREPGRLFLLDGRTLDQERSVPVGDGARHLGIAGPGGPVLVPVQFEDRLVSVDLPDGDPVTYEVGESPHDVAVADGRTFVGDEGGDTISVIENGRPIGTLDASEQPGAVEAVADKVAVIAVAERVLDVYDPHSLERLDHVDAGEGPTHAVADGNRLFVTDTQGDAILSFQIDPDTGAAEPGPAVPSAQGPYGIDIDVRRQTLWVTSTGENALTAYDVSGDAPRELESYPTVRQPNSVAVDEESGAVFVASRTDGLIQRITPEAKR